MRSGAGRRMATRILVAALIAASAAGCGGGEAEEDSAPTFTPPRTYDELDLDEPDAAVVEFASAFVRRDFVVAMLMLHPSTQAAMAADVTAADFGTWVMPDLEPAVQARVELERGGDHHLDALRVFEVAMEEAARNGGFRVDLAGGVEDVRVRTADGFTAVVDAVLTASDEVVVFELGPTADGRWRVRQARLENGSATELPFSGRPILGSPTRRLDVATTWRAALPNGSPLELLETIGALVARGDHFSVYLLLDAPAQREVATLLPPQASGIHELAGARLDEALDEAGFAFDLSALAPTPEPPEAAVTEPGGSFTFLVTVGESDLDVTVSLDGEGGWRLHRLAPVGDLASPVPFPMP